MHMKTKRPDASRPTTRPRLAWTAAATMLVSVLAPAAHASLFSGDTLDAVADGAAWVVLFIAPLAAIGIFLIIHILQRSFQIQNKRHVQRILLLHFHLEILDISIFCIHVFQ